MPNLEGRKAIFSVAQEPFEAQSLEDGPLHLFCTLNPLVFSSGEEADPLEFPNNGLVWCMLRPETRAHAEPGRLITGTIELAHAFDARDPDKSYYQLVRQSLEPVRDDDCLEILNVPDGQITQLRELVDRRDLIVLVRPPAGRCLIRWRGSIYGPFATASRRGPALDWMVSLTSPDGGSEFLRLSPESLNTLPGKQHHRLTRTVSLDTHTPSQSSRTTGCVYELLLAPGWSSLRGRAIETVSIESEEDLLRRTAKQLLTRRKRQELSRLLDDFSDLITPAAFPDAADLVARIQKLSASFEVETQALAHSLVDSGVLDSQIEREMSARFERYLQESASRAKAEVQRRVEETTSQLADLQRQVELQAAEIEARRRKAEQELEAELETRRSRDEVERTKRELEISEQLQELDRQRDILTKHLEAVAGRFESARAGVLNDFLTLVPLLERVQLLPRRAEQVEASPPAQRAESTRPPDSAEARQGVIAQVDFPAFVTEERSDSSEKIDEGTFFGRFVDFVNACGFSYRQTDLIAFHLSVKTGGLTILGGQAGTGKSSLPRLYARALGGSKDPSAARYLDVAVSPSWLDMRDVLGHVNALERRFEPAECGLYRHLIHASEETVRKGSASGIYLVNLDEMNLAHVEHYFSGFLQALERPAGERWVRCFEAASVSPESLFARWPSIELVDSLRFVGTVNLDETTKQLSQRLLDRANFLAIRSPSAGTAFSSAADLLPVPEGSQVTVDTYRSWKRYSPLDAAAASLLDVIRPLLAQAGCPLNPRRYRALEEFVASAPPSICTKAQALDLQIAQRLLPQIRAVLRREAQQALLTLTRALETHSDPMPESLVLLAEIQDRAFDEIGIADDGL